MPPPALSPTLTAPQHLAVLTRRTFVSACHIQEHYDASEALSCLLHSSIALHKDLEARPLSLEKCLDTFTAQEDIKEVRESGLCAHPG